MTAAPWECIAHWILSLEQRHFKQLDGVRNKRLNAQVSGVDTCMEVRMTRGESFGKEGADLGRGTVRGGVERRLLTGIPGAELEQGW